jgi:hypothetical protein
MTLRKGRDSINISSQIVSTSVTRGLSHCLSEGPDRLATSGPGMDTRAELDEGGRIDLWMDLKHKLTDGNVDLPENYAPDIKEYAVDKHATDCPPLNIVIFLVGSRGESRATEGYLR